jgi:hypothetical protein
MNDELRRDSKEASNHDLIEAFASQTEEMHKNVSWGKWCPEHLLYVSLEYYHYTNLISYSYIPLV